MQCARIPMVSLLVRKKKFVQYLQLFAFHIRCFYPAEVQFAAKAIKCLKVPPVFIFKRSLPLKDESYFNNLCIQKNQYTRRYESL